MPAFNERTFKKTIPISLLVFFIVLMNLVMIFHYLLPNKKFTSPVIEDFLDSLASTMKDKDLYTLLQNCLPNTLDTTVEWVGSDKKDPRAFLITGDSMSM